MNKIIITLVLIFSAFGFAAKAQTAGKSTEKNNYLVLTKNIEQLKPILLTAQKLAAEDGKNFGSFEVIVCGKTVQDLTDTAKLKPLLEMADKLNVQLVACGLSLNKFKVDAQKIPTRFKIVENGILYGFQQQKKGFYVLSI